MSFNCSFKRSFSLNVVITGATVVQKCMIEISKIIQSYGKQSVFFFQVCFATVILLMKYNAGDTMQDI